MRSRRCNVPTVACVRMPERPWKGAGKPSRCAGCYQQPCQRKLSCPDTLLLLGFLGFVTQAKGGSCLDQRQHHSQKRVLAVQSQEALPLNMRIARLFLLSFSNPYKPYWTFLGPTTPHPTVAKYRHLRCTAFELAVLGAVHEAFGFAADSFSSIDLCLMQHMLS